MEKKMNDKIEHESTKKLTEKKDVNPSETMMQIMKATEKSTCT